MDNFYLAKNGNPIHQGKVEIIILLSQFLVKTENFQTYPSYFMPPFLMCAAWISFFYVLAMPAFSLLPIYLRVGTSICRSLVTDDVHRAELVSKTGDFSFLRP